MSMSSKHPLGIAAQQQLEEQWKAEGQKIAYGEMLSWLEDKYLNKKKRPERGSPEAKAILELAADMGELIRAKMGKN